MTTTPLELRVPNVLLRRARQSMRMSQDEFAGALRSAGAAMGEPNRCTKRLVQKWESGEHGSCRPEYLRVLQTVTGLSSRELGFNLLPDDSGLVSVAGSGVAEGVASRESCADAGSARVAAALARHSSVDIIADATQRLRHALDHPSSVELGTAHLVEASTFRLFDVEQHSPARLLAPSVERHLGTVTALLTAARHESVRRKLTGSAGVAALLVGWLAFDRGDHASALTFWDNATGAAEATMNDALLAAALTFQSYAAARRDDPNAAWQLAYDASALTPEDPRATAWATSRVALYTALVGEREESEAAMWRSLEIGEDLPNPRPGDGGHPWMRSFDRAVLLSSAAHTAALLNDSDAALSYAASAVEALGPAKVKSRAVVLAQVTIAAALVGDLKRCLDYGSAAAPLTRDLDVSVAADLLRDVIPVLLPYCDDRAVRELMPHLKQFISTVDREDGAEHGRDSPVSSLHEHDGGSGAPAAAWQSGVAGVTAAP